LQIGFVNRHEYLKEWPPRTLLVEKEFTPRIVHSGQHNDVHIIRCRLCGNVAPIDYKSMNAGSSSPCNKVQKLLGFYLSLGWAATESRDQLIGIARMNASWQISEIVERR
jgi:hypothetical protein